MSAAAGVCEPEASVPPLLARSTRPRDLAFVMAAERHTDNREFVLQWSEEEHEKALGDPSAAHWVLEDARGRRIGFVILRGIGDPNGSVEFKRLVIVEEGCGFGRAAVRLVKEAAFRRFGAHRLWLDVKTHNGRAQRLYLSEGFVVEGTSRECRRSYDGRGWESLVVMSILDREYA